jgi:hypothetical protein
MYGAKKSDQEQRAQGNAAADGFASDRCKDYFELACEDDEFGVHIPDQADDK